MKKRVTEAYVPAFGVCTIATWFCSATTSFRWKGWAYEHFKPNVGVYVDHGRYLGGEVECW